MTRSVDALEAAIRDERAFWNLVESRAAQIREYLQEAADREAGSVKWSLRFENRPDHRNCREVIGLFRERWWGVVVYSCFDSVDGTKVVAPRFAAPLSAAAAERALRGLDPRIQSHRAQVGRTRSKRSLISACAKAERLKPVFTGRGLSFDERFDALGRIHIYAWNRTTNFDALGRAGTLKTDRLGFRPDRAYLADSSGPATGFARVWGISVTPTNADHCEALLRKWTSRWSAVTQRVGVVWKGEPYDSADLENALCVLKKHR